jgi:hypothetical protein
MCCSKQVATLLAERISSPLPLANSAAFAEEELEIHAWSLVAAAGSLLGALGMARHNATVILCLSLSLWSIVALASLTRRSLQSFLLITCGFIIAAIVFAG